MSEAEEDKKTGNNSDFQTDRNHDQLVGLLWEKMDVEITGDGSYLGISVFGCSRESFSDQRLSVGTICIRFHYELTCLAASE